MVRADRSSSATAWWRFARRWLSFSLLAIAVAGCGGGGGGDVDDDLEPPPPPPGGTGTGADGVPIFWQVFGNNVAYGRSHAVSATADGGFVAAGFQSVDNGPNDLHVVKTDGAGAVQWERRIPVTGGAIAYAVTPIAAGGYMVAGTIGDGPVARAVMLRLDADGNPLGGWPKVFGDAGTAAFGMLAVNGGADGYLLTGVSGPNPYVLRVGATGELLWANTGYAPFCPGGGAIGAAITATSDGSYVIAGRTGCLEWAGFLLKIEPTIGSEVWRQVLDDPIPSNYASLDAVVETPDGGLLAGGRAGPNCFLGETVGDCAAVVIKTAADGVPQWTRRYGGAQIDSASSVAVAADGSYLVAGTTRSYGGVITDPAAAFMWDDLMLVKVTPSGDTSWQKVKGVRPLAIDTALALAAVSDGGFVVAGEAGGNPLLARFDRNGDTVYLGSEYDLTITVPSSLGVIKFDNGVAVAGIGANGLILPQQVGGALLDRLVAASAGALPGEFCTSGTYTFSPAVPAALPVGGSYALSFDNCRSGEQQINGGATLTVNAVGGTPGSANYSLTASVANLSLTAEEIGSVPALSQSFVGGLRIARTVASSNRGELVDSLAGVTLAVTETSGGTTMLAATYGPFSVRYAQPVTAPLAVGQVGDAVTAMSNGDTFAIEALQSLPLSPTTLEVAGNGSYRVTAQDSSRLTATLSPSAEGGSAVLAIDTDGDGTVDGSLSVPWDFVY